MLPEAVKNCVDELSEDLGGNWLIGRGVATCVADFSRDDNGCADDCADSGFDFCIEALSAALKNDD